MTTEQFKILCTMNKDIITSANQALMDIHMNLIRKFLEEGQEHGTVVEALYYAFRAILDGEAKTLQEALETGAGEWYK